MASTYSTNLRLEKQTDGENNTTWGAKANVVFDLVEEALTSMETITTTSGTVTLTTNNSASDQARKSVLKITSALIGNLTIVVPDKNKHYLVWNASSGAYTVTVKTNAGTGVAVTQGTKRFVYCDATNVVDATATLLASEITNTPAGTIAATTVQAAIDELDTEKAAKSGFTATGDIILSGNAAIEEARANITQHATTMDFWAGPNVLDGTGSAVTITACVNAPQAGARRKVYPLAGTILTHGATFDIDGNVNQTAVAGDCWEFVAKTTSTYKVHVTKEDGTAVVASTALSVPVRQTVLGGPVTSAGLPNFLPSTSVNLNLTTQNVSATAPNVLSVAASNGNAGDATGASNRVGFSTSNLTWTGLTASRAAATPNYLFVDIDSAGVMTTGFTILAPVYQWGGTYSTTNLQNTFNIQEMTMKVGDGAAVTQKWRVFVGEAATDGTTVISTVAYAYQGRYISDWINTLPSTITIVSSHNIGMPEIQGGFSLKNLTTEFGYSVGQITDGVGNYNYSRMILVYERNTITMVSRGPSYSLLSQSTGLDAGPLTLANWAYRFVARRAW